MPDKRVTFVTDNAALVDIINKQASKYKIVLNSIFSVPLVIFREGLMSAIFR